MAGAESGNDNFGARRDELSASLRAAGGRGAATLETAAGAPARTPVVAMPAVQRERERMLPPGAGGPHGAPYKLLRTQVLQRLQQLDANVLAILSPAPGAGKTLTAINLAIAIAAESARTVLLVDFDLRHPGIAARFGLSPKVGIEDCLRSRRPVHEALLRVEGYERLTLLPAREPVEHSGELLAEQLTAELMEEMRGRYVNRVLIFDLPPVLYADDALIFSRYAGAGLMVIAEGRTRREDLSRAFELMREVPIVGTVLNGARDADAARY